MSEENAEVVHGSWLAPSTGGLAAMTYWFAPEVEWVARGTCRR